MMKASRVGAGSSGEVPMAEQRNSRLSQLPVMLALMLVCSTNVAGVAGDDPAGKPPTAARKVVVLVHGLKQDARDLQKLNDFLGRDTTLSVLRFGYKSRKDLVEDAAAGLVSFVQRKAPKSEVHFVGFSLGNLVIRQYQQKVRKQGLQLKIGRVVMIAPPNHGSRKAVDLNGPGALYFLGPATRQIGVGFPQLEPELDIPSDFGIIAGGKGDGRGFKRGNGLPGDDDGWLRVETTKLIGAADFRLVKARHEKLDDHPLVHKLTRKFLQAGFFESKATRQRIR
ncbi:MAG TPA: hypothetical protein DCE47_23160 [Planctomycetaceae bacterium]|nr:hypothetical protein [Planctomycetaceae bacterium]